ncbi:MAG: hypothetical protein EOP56_18455 [Sphingobacteriales bacterium]|nr:MAG: hypothetical protein EOP56_18455 [Sphingobacteriales bacterium]
MKALLILFCAGLIFTEANAQGGRTDSLTNYNNRLDRNNPSNPYNPNNSRNTLGVQPSAPVSSPTPTINNPEIKRLNNSNMPINNNGTLNNNSYPNNNNTLGAPSNGNLNNGYSNPSAPINNGMNNRIVR